MLFYKHTSHHTKADKFNVTYIANIALLAMNSQLEYHKKQYLYELYSNSYSCLYGIEKIPKKNFQFLAIPLHSWDLPASVFSLAILSHEAYQLITTWLHKDCWVQTKQLTWMLRIIPYRFEIHKNRIARHSFPSSLND